MRIKELTKDDSLIIKGLAILAIVLHNIFRWVDPSTGENEFGFYINCISNFANLITSQPKEFINIIFSFLGHYGVQLFILISGYGLTKSMLAKPQCWLAFMGNRLKKIYPLLILAILGFIIANYFIDNQLPTNKNWYEIGLKLLFVHTLTPDEGLTLCGPWWFFGLIVQLYILFPILLNLTQRHGTKILAGTALLSYIWILTAIYCYDKPGNSLLAMQNAPGHLPEFCFGIWLALAPRKINRLWLIPAITVFCLGNFFEPFYPFTFLAVSVIFVIGYNDIKGFIAKHRILERPLTFVGSISMFLFAVHGFLRQPFIDWANNSSAIFKIIMALAFLAASIAAALALRPLYRLILKGLDHIKLPVWVLKANKPIMAATLLFLAFVTFHYAASIVQEHNEFEKNTYTQNLSFKTCGDIYADSLFSDILIADLKRCKLIKLAIDIEIDTEGNDIDSIPLLVTEVTDIYWNNIPLPKTDGFEKCHFEHIIPSSFIDRHKNKTFKLYFWNRNKSSMKFRNAKIKIDY